MPSSPCCPWVACASMADRSFPDCCVLRARSGEWVAVGTSSRGMCKQCGNCEHCCQQPPSGTPRTCTAKYSGVLADPMRGRGRRRLDLLKPRPRVAVEEEGKKEEGEKEEEKEEEAQALACAGSAARCACHGARCPHDSSKCSRCCATCVEQRKGTGKLRKTRSRSAQPKSRMVNELPDDVLEAMSAVAAAGARAGLRDESVLAPIAALMEIMESREFVAGGLAAGLVDTDRRRKFSAALKRLDVCRSLRGSGLVSDLTDPVLRDLASVLSELVLILLSACSGGLCGPLGDLPGLWAALAPRVDDFLDGNRVPQTPTCSTCDKVVGVMSAVLAAQPRASVAAGVVCAIAAGSGLRTRLRESFHASDREGEREDTAGADDDSASVGSGDSTGICMSNSSGDSSGDSSDSCADSYSSAHGLSDDSTSDCDVGGVGSSSGASHGGVREVGLVRGKRLGTWRRGRRGAGVLGSRRQVTKALHLLRKLCVGKPVLPSGRRPRGKRVSNVSIEAVIRFLLAHSAVLSWGARTVKLIGGGKGVLPSVLRVGTYDGVYQLYKTDMLRDGAGPVLVSRTTFVAIARTLAPSTITVRGLPDCHLCCFHVRPPICTTPAACAYAPSPRGARCRFDPVRCSLCDRFQARTCCDNTAVADGYENFASLRRLLKSHLPPQDYVQFDTDITKVHRFLRLEYPTHIMQVLSAIFLRSFSVSMAKGCSCITGAISDRTVHRHRLCLPFPFRAGLPQPHS